MVFVDMFLSCNLRRGGDLVVCSGKGRCLREEDEEDSFGPVVGLMVCGVRK